jgi:excinuclease ABC subunit C
MRSGSIIPEYLSARLKELPAGPGVYLFRDREGKMLYIGKALSIRKRVAGHFRFYGEGASTKEGLMLSQTVTVDVMETPTEAEALLLESAMVKERMPKYNKMLRDDKSYPFLKITGEEYPRLLVVRGRKSDGGKYFGPYTNVRLLRQAVTWLRREFPLRTCKTIPKKLCLMYHIGQCGGPCEAVQSAESYRATVKELENFLLGKREALVRNLTKRMRAHSENKEYEKAQTLLELVRALSSVPLTGAPQRPSPTVLDDAQKAFSLPTVPRRMECFDISNIHGKEAVGSMVVFIDGKPARSEYRRFRIRTVEGIDDYRMMREVVGRRYRRRLEEKEPMPDLVLIDGGKGHLAAAKKELDEIGLEALPILSIAKQHEIIFAPGREEGYRLSASSPVLQMMRHLRDEAHRFAIRFHRHLHRKEALVSQLDNIPGVGPKSRQKLLKKFGTLDRMRQATEEALVEEAGLTRRAALAVIQTLSEPTEEVA